MAASLFSRLNRWISTFFTYVTATLLFVLMAVTCVDVTGRYFFNHPLFGGLELTEILLAGMVFFALPLVCAREENIVIDLMTMPQGKLRIAQNFLANIAGAVTAGVMAQQMWLRALRLDKAGETTIQIKIPLDMVGYTISGLLAVTAIAFLVRAFIPSPVPASPQVD